MTDPHRELLEAWLARRDKAFTTSEAIALGLGVSVDRSLQTRIGPLLHELGCAKVRVRRSGRRAWAWEPPATKSE